jgi:L-alanine-DL-glutamate epimerase-like enolase superfamily enzyme
MKIHDLELFLVGPAASRCLLVRVTTSTGLEGWGESTLGWRPDELAARREALLAVLAGRSVYDIEELHSLEALSPPPLRSAIEMAVWDLLGHVLRQPLCNLLGGYYRRRVPVSVRLSGSGSGVSPAGHPEGGRRPKVGPGKKPPITFLPQIARELAEQGFHTQTIVTEGRPDEDLKTLRAIREMVGDRIELRLDGLGRFDAETARDLCAGLEFEGLQFFLDPLSTPELHAAASLGRQTSVPLAAWRAIHAPADLLTAVRWGAAPFVVIDLEQVGGIVPARACAAVAAAGGVVPLLGRRASAGIATAAMLHLAAATAAFSTAHEIAPHPFDDTVLAESPAIVDGMAPVPQGYGLGIEVDRAKLERR